MAEQDRYCAQLRDSEARLAEVTARLKDAEQRADGYVSVIRQLESQLANSAAQLADARRLNQQYADQVHQYETNLASVLAKLEDAKRQAAAVPPTGDTALDVVANTRLEDLLERYDLASLARTVKARRVLMERDLAASRLTSRGDGDEPGGSSR